MMESVSPVFKKKISGFNILNLVIALGVLLGSLSASAQEIACRIAWSPTPKTMTVVGDKKITQPTFNKAAHLQQYGMLPVYTQLFPANSAGTVAVQVLNPVYSAATNLDNASIKYISTTLNPTGLITFYRKQPKTSVSLLPFRKNPTTGVIEKLESFTLKITVTPTRQLKSLNSYAANSVLASGTWYKVSVNADGIYKIDYNYLKKTLGVDPSTINVSKLAIFGNGGGMVPDLNSVARPDDLQENPTLFVDNNNNGQFDNGDYLLFYGQMADDWKLNAATNHFYHEKNLYSDVTYYFLTPDAGTGKRVQTVSATGGSINKTFNYFDERAYRDNDQYNLLQSGKTWVGDQLTSFSTTESFSHSFPNLITSDSVIFNSFVAVNAGYSSNTTVNINGQQVAQFPDGGIATQEYQIAADTHSVSQAFIANSSNLNITYNFQVTSDPSGTAAFYIDWYELLLKRGLSLSGDAMNFRNIASIGPGVVSTFQLSNATSNTLVWDVTNIGAIQQMSSTLSGSQLSFAANTDILKEFVAFNTNGSFSNPQYVEQVPNQNLHATGQPNMIIVAYDDFMTAANDLANYHIANDNISAKAVPLSQIYNEFGSGKPDISAIRDFMEMLYQRGGTDTSKLPRYLLLMGDGSFDPKNRTANANNFVPTYQSTESYDPLNTYTADDFYGLLDQNEGGQIENGGQMLDVAIGRLPVESEAEAEAMVTKIKNYKNSSAASGCATCAKATTNNSWRTSLTYISDYLFDGGDLFEDSSDALAEATRAQNPAYNYNKIYTDAYKLQPTPAGDRFPDVNAAILSTINNGTLLINWVGHGGPTNWSNARTFNMADIVQLQNQFYPLFITCTCEFSRFDLPDRTAGEWVVVNGTGGGIASITTVRLVFAYDNNTIDTAIFDYLFASYNGRHPTMGEITMLSKNDVIFHTDGPNTRKFCLLGDPAVTLDYPRYNVATTMIDNKPVSAPHDTLKALTRVTIKGQVTDDNNNKLTSFNGTIYPVVYDKISAVQTLNNPTSPPSGGSVITFYLYKNILFKGQATVSGGDFSFTFVVPKDINYQYGNGRISYYATNGSSLDAFGYSNDIIVGGSSDTAKTYGNGPKVNVYMDDQKFVYGGTTTANPLLLVELQDPGGINTAGSGVGHNMTAVLDYNSQNPIILNNYYQTAVDNYTQGEVRYPFTNLTPGNHTLSVKAWDIYDQSTVANTEFVVTNNAKLALNHVYNYPNPFTTHTEFMFEHNMPCSELNVSVQIYSVSGRLVKNIFQQVQTTGYRVDGIVWDGLDDYGSPIGKGVYVYKVTVRDANGDVANKFEKLVVLR